MCEYHKNKQTEEFDEPIKINTNECPECKTLTVTSSEDGSYEYCTECGLITRASYEYTAGIKFKLPYGILIQ